MFTCQFGVDGIEFFQSVLIQIVKYISSTIQIIIFLLKNTIESLKTISKDKSLNNNKKKNQNIPTEMFFIHLEKISYTGPMPSFLDFFHIDKCSQRKGYS